MLLRNQFEAACETACKDRSITKPHLTAIVRNVLNDPRTGRLLDTLVAEQIENSAGTAVLWEAVFYFADGEGKSDQAAVDKVKAKIPPIQWQLILTKERTARRRMNQGNSAAEVRQPSRSYAAGMARSSGISRQGRQMIKHPPGGSELR